MMLAWKLQVMDFLGSAAFSKAVQALDIKLGRLVCLKIIKNNKDYFDQSLDEIKLLSYVNSHDPDDEYGMLRLYDYFYYKVCHCSRTCSRYSCGKSQTAPLGSICKGILQLSTPCPGLSLLDADCHVSHLRGVAKGQATVRRITIPCKQAIAVFTYANKALKDNFYPSMCSCCESCVNSPPLEAARIESVHQYCTGAPLPGVRAAAC